MNGGKKTQKTVNPVCPLSLLEQCFFNTRAKKSLKVEYKWLFLSRPTMTVYWRTL